jgi:hypothetical protein
VLLRNTLESNIVVYFNKKAVIDLRI